jgi:WD40 repeat protein
MDTSREELDESLLGQVVDDFTDRCHRGETLSVDDYVRRYPALGAVLAQLLPAIQTLADQSHRESSQVLSRGLAQEHAPPEETGEGQRDSTLCQTQARWPRLPGYEILEELGTGGMGVVYRARDVELDRMVAIKVLRDNSATIAHSSERLQIEAKSLAKINHPHIVQIFEVGRYDERPFLSLEFCPGGSLAEKSAGRPQPPHCAAEIVLKLAGAIQAAHEAGLIHRDLKPANVLLTADGTPKIADFGLVRWMDVEQDHTRTGAIVGTPSYMAPEQTTGVRGQITAAVDIYALGATLYELLVGRPPFKAASFFATLEQVRRDEPVPPRTLQPDIPRDLETICLKCLHKDPSARYRTAADLADDLRRFLQERPVRARRIGAARRVRQWVRHNPIAAAMLATVVLSLAAGLAALEILSRETPARLPRAAVEADVKADVAETVALQPEGPQRSKETNRTNTFGAVQPAPATARGTQEPQQVPSQSLVESRLAQAQASRRSGRAGRRFESLKSLAETVPLISELGLGEDARRKLRNEAIASMALVDLRVDRHWIEPRGDDHHVRVRMDQNLEKFALLEQDGRIVVRRMDDRAELHGFPWLDNSLDKTPLSLLSPDGRYLAVKGGPPTGPQEVRLWDLSNGQELLACLAYGSWSDNWHDRAMAFSADSRQLAYGAPDGSIRIFDARLGQEAVRISIPMPDMPYAFAFRPDGGQLAATQRSRTQPGGVFLINLPDGAIERTLAHPASLHGTDWSPDGRKLAVACGDGRIYIWDVATGELLQVCKRHNGNAIHVAFNSTGELIASSGWDKTTRLWDSRTGESLLVANLRGTQFSTDDRWLAFNFTGFATGRWEVATASECRVLVSPSGRQPVASLAFSPDGQVLASAGSGGAGYRLWSAEDGRELASIPCRADENCGTVLFEPDGKYLITSDSTVRRWRLETTPEGVYLDAPEQLLAGTAQSESGIWEASLDRSASSLLLTNRGENAVLWDYVARKPVLTFDEDPKIFQAAISPNGAWIVTSALTETDLEIWNVGSQRIEKVLPIGVARFTFSPDSRRLVIVTAGRVEVREVGTWNEVPALAKNTSGFTAVAYSPDMRLLALTQQEDILLLDANTGEEIATLTPPRKIDLRSDSPEGTAAIAFSPDGTQLAVGSRGGLIFLWDLGMIREQLAAMNLDWSHPVLPPRGQSRLGRAAVAE